MGAGLKEMLSREDTVSQSHKNARHHSMPNMHFDSVEGFLANGVGISYQQQCQDAVNVAASGSNLKNNGLYKTELCHSFEETNSCKYGDKCKFAHGRGELRRVSRHPKYKTDLCKTFHTVGTCPYGTRCHFIHNLDEVGRDFSNTSMDSSLSRTRSSSSSISPTNVQAEREMARMNSEGYRAPTYFDANIHQTQHIDVNNQYQAYLTAELQKRADYRHSAEVLRNYNRFQAHTEYVCQGYPGSQVDSNASDQWSQQQGLTFREYPISWSDGGQKEQKNTSTNVSNDSISHCEASALPMIKQHQYPVQKCQVENLVYPPMAAVSPHLYNPRSAGNMVYVNQEGVVSNPTVGKTKAIGNPGISPTHSNNSQEGLSMNDCPALHKLRSETVPASRAKSLPHILEEITDEESLEKKKRLPFFKHLSQAP